jgi:hypothetical protein
MAQSSQRKEPPQNPGRFNLGIDLGAVWLVVEQDLPPLSEALNRMIEKLESR